MGTVRMGAPTEFILKLKKEFRIENFIETGTFLGETAYWASQHFSKVSTIEFSESIYQNAIQRYEQVKNIEFFYGHSTDKLRDIVAVLREPAIFWLDAHWSGGKTYGSEDECPLIQEIEIIKASSEKHFILVDDARMFVAPPPRPHRPEGWPDITTVVNSVNSDYQSYVVIIEDVIVAVPQFAKPIVVSYCQDIATQQWQEQASAGIREGVQIIMKDVKKTIKKTMNTRDRSPNS